MAGTAGHLPRRWRVFLAALAVGLFAFAGATQLFDRGSDAEPSRKVVLAPAQIRSLRTLRLADYDVRARLTAAERALRVEDLRLVECRLAREDAAYDGSVDAVEAWRIREACGFGPIRLEPPRDGP